MDRAQCPGVRPCPTTLAPPDTQPGDPEPFFLQLPKSSPEKVPWRRGGTGEAGVGGLEAAGASSFLPDTE